MNVFFTKTAEIPQPKFNDGDNKWKEVNLTPENIICAIQYIPKNFMPLTGGIWTEKPGDSIWIPNPDGIPKKDNPDNKTWGEILKKYEIFGIEFKDGYPDFYPISQVEMKIDNFSSDRQKNFAQADEKLAEQWSTDGKDGKTDWTAQDIAQYRKNNGFTWHEHQDCKILQLVPKEIHNNIPHEGGISAKKKEINLQGATNEYLFR